MDISLDEILDDPWRAEPKLEANQAHPSVSPDYALLKGFVAAASLTLSL